MLNVFNFLFYDFGILNFIFNELINLKASNLIMIQRSNKNRFNEFLKNTKKSDSEGYIQNIQIEEVLEIVS